MNKWLLLLILIGLGVAGWMNRDRISELLGQHKEEEPAAATPAPVATPNPAPDSIALARKTYPALAQSG